MNIKVASQVLLVLVLAGCKSAPVRMNESMEGHWKAKALVKDNEQSRSYIIQLNFNAKRDETARMDATTVFGTGVASLLVTGKEVRYVLVDSKRYYYGNSQPGVMRPILSIPFDPRWIHNILFEVPFTEKNWSCARDPGGWLTDCRSAADNLKVTWSGRSSDRKTVTLEHPKATVQINVLSFKPKVEDRKNLFVLEAPEGYQKLRVR